MKHPDVGQKSLDAQFWGEQNGLGGKQTLKGNKVGTDSREREGCESWGQSTAMGDSGKLWGWLGRESFFQEQPKESVQPEAAAIWVQKTR